MGPLWFDGALLMSLHSNVSPTETSATKREIPVEIPAEEVARETLTIIEKYQKLARIPGFRRGHVPASVIRQRFKEDLKSDVVEALVPRYFRREATKLGLHPFRSPRSAICTCTTTNRCVLKQALRSCRSKGPGL